MIVAGLTGSIGMGKSTTANMFRDENIPVYDADAAVHELYQGEAVPLVEAAFPGSLSAGKIDRKKLGQMVIGDDKAMVRLEALIHPLVRIEENKFLAAARAKGEKLAVLDIPLLLETGGKARVDVVIVVTASLQEQKKRVLSRDDMNEQKLDAILARQMPDSEKRGHADFVIDTTHGLISARDQVRAVIRSILQR